jgi:hypothetical protein
MTEFKAFLVKMNSSPQLHFGLAGVIVFGVSIIFLMLGIFVNLSYFLLICGIVIVLIGALSNKGKGLVEVDTEILIINHKGIQIGASLYPYNEITNLVFYFDGYNGQSPFGYFTETSGRVEYGMFNRISFSSKDLSISEMFYLSDQKHSDSFFLTISLLQKQGISIEMGSRKPEK